MNRVDVQRSYFNLETDLPLPKPRVLVVLPAFIPSTQIYVVKPILGLHCRGLITAEIVLEHTVSYRSLAKADVLIFCRNTESAYQWILDFALNENKPFVYELDDNFFEIPPTTEVGRYHRAPERLDQLERYLRAASLVRVYSEALSECVAKLNRKVVRIEGPVDWSLMPQKPPPRHRGKIRIVYATSRIEDDLAKLFLNDICQLLQHYDGGIEMFFWGYHPPELRSHPAVRFLPLIRNYDSFFRKFARSQFDIGLAPLLKDGFCRSKSNVKFREYAACGIAGIYSKVGSYRECVEDELTGLLVETDTGGWFEAIKRLIDNMGLRQSIQKNGLAFARKHYDLEAFQEVLWAQIQKLIVARVDWVSSGPRKNFSAGTCSGRPRTPSKSEAQPRPRVLKHWRYLPSKALRHIASQGFCHTLGLIRWPLNDRVVLLRLKMILQFWWRVKACYSNGMKSL
jgi:glycosyltransferase involved in cell wall biosynthesis